MQGDELAYQRQADARALVSAGARIGSAIEAREDLVEILGRYADPRVLDGQREGALVLAQADIDRALGRELERIGEQVGDNPLPGFTIDVGLVGEWRAIHRQAKPRLLSS